MGRALALPNSFYLKKDKMNWIDYYKPPYKYDGRGYVRTSENVNALYFQLGVMEEEDRQKVVDAINGESDKKIEGLYEKDGGFYLDDQLLFLVRGWGYLIGISACNLPMDKAAEIQNGFIEYVKEKLIA